MEIYLNTLEGDNLHFSNLVTGIVYCSFLLQTETFEHLPRHFTIHCAITLTIRAVDLTALCTPLPCVNFGNLLPSKLLTRLYGKPMSTLRQIQFRMQM